MLRNNQHKPTLSHMRPWDPACHFDSEVDLTWLMGILEQNPPHFLFRPLGGKYFVYRMMWMNRANLFWQYYNHFFFQEQFQNKVTKMQLFVWLSFRTCLGRASKCNDRNGHQVAHSHHPTFSLPNLHSILSEVERESQQKEDQLENQKTKL